MPQFPKIFLLLPLLLLLMGNSMLADGKELERLLEILVSRGGDTTVDFVVQASEVSVPLRGYGQGTVFNYTGRLYVYNGVASVPGPLVHVKPGGRLVMNVLNGLGKETYTESVEDIYRFHMANTTNVHFHGVHGDPRVDNVFQTASSGKHLKYKLKIPKDHFPGLHWYHTHAHGSAYLLLMGGLFGPLVVDPITTTSSRAKDTFTTTRSLPSFVLMMHLYRLGTSTICDGITIDAVDEAIGTDMYSRPRIVSGNGTELPMPSDLFLVNGQHQPTITVNEGQSTLLRLIFASGSCYVNVSFPESCHVNISAIDGVPLKHIREVKGRWLYFTTSTRYDVVMTCGHKRSEELPVMLKKLDEPIFYINVRPNRLNSNNKKKKKHQHKPYEFQLPIRSEFREVHYLSADEPPTVRRDISFSQLDLPSPRPYYVIGQGANCSSLVNSSSCFYEHFSGEKGTLHDNYQGFVVPLDAVVEARIFGDPSDEIPHPLHLHVNHFVFVNFTSRKGGQHENLSMADFGIFPGDVRDTIPILDGETIIRWRAASYVGEVVYHCHTLTHEDQGMMNSYLVYMDTSKSAQSSILFTEDDPVAERAGDRRFFLGFAIVFFVCSLLCAIFGWLRSDPSRAEKWAHRHKPISSGNQYHSDEGSEMERQPLRV